MTQDILQLKQNGPRITGTNIFIFAQYILYTHLNCTLTLSSVMYVRMYLCNPHVISSTQSITMTVTSYSSNHPHNAMVIISSSLCFCCELNVSVVFVKESPASLSGSLFLLCNDRNSRSTRSKSVTGSITISLYHCRSESVT